MNDELVRFVREALAQRIPKPEIRSKLLEARWPEDEVESALDAFADVEFSIPVPRPKVYLSARDAFLYLALFSTLYTSAISLGSLLYEFINRAFPDPAMIGVALNVAAVRWSTSALIIGFPIFLVLSRVLYRAIRRDPEKRTSKVRKWLTYLTLFVAAGIVLGDLITLVFNVLGGELTGRFLLKVLVVGGIAGSVFGFYLWDLRREDVEPGRDWAAKHIGVRVFAGLVAATVGAAIVGGLFLAGSPGRARLTRLDDRREVDLQMISGAVDVFWSQNQELPADLDQLSRERGVRLRSIRDPETAEPYEYRPTGEKSYELCASFDREDEGPEDRYRSEPSAGRELFWTHGAGRVCFPVEAAVLSRVVLEPQPTLEEPRVEPRARPVTGEEGAGE